MANHKLLLLLGLGLLVVLMAAQPAAAQDDASGSGDGEAASGDAEAEAEASGDAAAEEGGDEAAAEEGGDDEAAAEEEGKEGDGGEEADEVNSEADAEEEGSGDAEAEAEGSADEDGSGSGDAEAEAEASGSDALAAVVWECDKDGMDEKVAGCMDSMDERVGVLEQAILSGEGGGLGEQIELVLVKKGVIDCENSTQCSDDRACIDSYVEPGRQMCEKPCERTQCPVAYSECIAKDHVASCMCKEGFHGNGTKACFPEGFDEEENGKSYKMFDNAYVEFQNASDTCTELGARLPVLDTAETIAIVKKYMEESNFTVFEQWDRSSRRVWLGLVMGQGLTWADRARVQNYPASSRLFVWEARRMLSEEVSYADNSRSYALYIDGDIAKLPGGGRKGAAVLCELIPSQIQEPGQQQQAYDPYANDPRYQQQYQQQQQQQQDPYAQQRPAQGQDPYGRQDPYAQQRQEQDPYAQQRGDPYAQQPYPTDGGYPPYQQQG